MKAIVHYEYGTPDVLQVADMPKPSIKDNMVLVRVRATSVNFGDTFARNFKAVTPRSFTMPAILWLPTRLTFGWNKPRNPILGSEFAGEIVEVGSAVTRFKVGDAVFGYRGASMKANAEYLAVKETSLITHKPDNISDEAIATIPYGAITAMSLLRKAKIQPGQKVLINGASGSIGAAALQLAKIYGAEVTAVCGTGRMGMVKALGADHVIDYTQTDFTKTGEQYDLIVDVKHKAPFERSKNALTATGIYLPVSFKLKDVWQNVVTARSGGKRVICALSSDRLEDLEAVRDLVASGQYRAVVDRVYPMEEAAAAHRRAESNAREGSIVITFV